MIEEWRDVCGFEGIYQISNFGNIKSLDRERIISNGTIRRDKGKHINPFVTNDGYLKCTLNKSGKSKRFVHRLVAIAFIPNIYNNPQVNHKDNNPLNNHVDNLYWGTQADNVRDMNNSGRGHSGKKPRNRVGRPVLRCDKDGNIIKKYKSILSAKIDGFNSNGIRRSCEGQPNPYKNYYWKYNNAERQGD